MAWDRQVDNVEKLVDAAVAAGAKVETGGKRKPGPGLFFEPTVLTSCRQDMDVMRKEIFGPVIPIMKVETEDEAVRLANDSKLGLLAYVFTRDRERGRRLAERIEAGTVMVNDVLNTYACPETPWGGVKQSGIGRTHSVIGLRDLCETRHVNHDRVALGREVWWYPYKEGTSGRSSAARACCSASAVAALLGIERELARGAGASIDRIARPRARLGEQRAAQS